MPIGSRTPAQVPGTETPQTVSVTITANYLEQSYQKVFTCRSTELSTIAPTHTITQQAAVLSVTPSTRNVDATGGNSGIFTVTSTWGWTATSAQSWAVIFVSGNTFYARCSENKSTTSRTSTISVSNGYIMKCVTVTQDAAEISPFVFTNTPYNVTVSGLPASNPGVASLSAVGHTWTALSTQSWITLQNSSDSGSGSSSLFFSVPANGGSARTGSIIATSGLTGEQATFVVNQAAATLTINPTNAAGQASGGTGSFSVQSNTSWTATGSTNIVVTSGSSGSGNGNVSYSYAANNSGNARGLTIDVRTTSGQIVRTFMLNQVSSDPVLIVNPNSAVFNSGDDNRSLTITSTSAWNATSNESWLTLGSWSGAGNAPVTAYSAPNTTPSQRQGTITFTNSQGLTATFIGSQYAGATLTVSPSVITVDGGNRFIVTVTSSEAWTASSNVDWLTLDRTSGIAGSAIQIGVQVGSATGEYRYGIIRVSNGSNSQYVDVTCTDKNS